MSNKLKPSKIQLTRAQVDEIRTIADSLPPIIEVDKEGKPIMRTVIRCGANVKKSDLSPGTPLVPGAKYRLLEFTYVDHRTACETLLVSGGMKAV